jgi:antitoxin HicB
MTRTLFSYPARLDPDEDGRLVVHFPDLPEALTDGADKVEALREAADCLSTALAARMAGDEEFPPPGRLRRGQYWVAPEPTMSLKAALYSALRARGMAVRDLARGLGIDHRRRRVLSTRAPRASSPASTRRSRRSATGSRSKYTKSRRHNQFGGQDRPSSPICGLPDRQRHQTRRARALRQALDGLGLRRQPGGRSARGQRTICPKSYANGRRTSHSNC